MHKLMHKGLKKKKKSKKGKKEGEEEEFDPEELERYRRERAEALVKASSEVGDQSSSGEVGVAGSDEWKKFQVLTAGVDSILKKTQGDLDRIKSTSFFQRKAPVVAEIKSEEDPEVTKNKAKRWIGFDKEGNPIEQQFANKEGDKIRLSVDKTGFVEIPEDEDDEDDSLEEDLFDTAYVDVLQNIDVQLAYIPDSPIEEQSGDDPFDTTNADKVLKTVDKHGKKIVSLGNAVEVLSGRIDHVSTCKISRPKKGHIPNLLLDDLCTDENICEAVVEQFAIEKTLLDEDDNSELPDVPIDLTILPPIVNPEPRTNGYVEVGLSDLEVTLDISEFEIVKEKKILEDIPDLDDEFDLDGPILIGSVQLEYAADPFAEKESVDVKVDNEIIEASFEVATFVNEEDPFDTTFAENLVPGKAELKFIERELDQLPESAVEISLTDPSGIYRDYETGLLSSDRNHPVTKSYDLLGESITDLTQLVDQPIVPVDEITYIDPFDTSSIEEPTPGQTELKFLEKELLASDKEEVYSLQDDDFDPRKDETSIVDGLAIKSNFEQKTIELENQAGTVISNEKIRKPSRPEALKIGSVKIVAFELPTPSQRPDLLITSDEEKSIASKPLTPYYSQKSLEEAVPEPDHHIIEVDPFDTSFVSKVTPGKTELKLIESELLEQEIKLTHSISVYEINNFEIQSTIDRRRSDFGTTSLRQKSLNSSNTNESLIEHNENDNRNVFEINEEVQQVKFKPNRQESLLDADVVVDAKPLTPCIESKVVKEELEAEISYVDPFDTSIASNILPGKAELKQLENELSRIPLHVHPVRIAESIDLSKVTNNQGSIVFENKANLDPRAADIIEFQDFLSLDGDNSGDKVLTPLSNNSYVLNESVDPFDTSFAVIEPGKTELKLLESELMNK